MITVISQFKFAHAVPIEKAREAALGTAPRYRGVPGLIRKYYTLAADGMSAGGIYLWKSRGRGSHVQQRRMESVRSR